MDSGAPRGPDGRFHNAHVQPGPRRRGGFLRWWRERNPAPWPRWVEDPPQPAPQRLAADRIGVTFINHASFYVQVAGVGILLDPIWSTRCSPIPFLGPKRVRAPGQPLAALPGVELLLISHCHYDHLDLPTLRQVQRRWGPPAITSIGTARHIAKARIKGAQELDWWQSVQHGPLTITCVPAQHFSARTLWDRNVALWGGFVIQGGGRSLYFAGDSGWCPHFAEIGARFPNLDVALLPIGAYAPRWFMKTQHMDPEEAVQAHLALGARQSVGMHYGTFAGLTDEPIEEPQQKLAVALQAQGVDPARFITLPFGGSLVL